MGLNLSQIFCKKEPRIVILGQPKSGKTSVLYTLKLGRNNFTTVPTIGLNVETVAFKNTKYCIWDIGGGDKVSRLWSQYCSDTSALIFVVDSSEYDSHRIASEHEAFHLIMDFAELRDVPILIFANKQDVSNAMTLSQIHERLELSKIHDRIYRLQPSCATSGVGLQEGLTWLTNNIQF